MAVDWDYVVEDNRAALKRILAMMLTMVAAGAAAVTGEAARPALPRHLYRAVLAILHPAESAARRLIVVAARGLVMPKPRLRPFVPKPRRKPSPTTIVFPHAARFPPPPPRPVPARIPLPLFDTLRPPTRRLRSVPASCAPRITLPGLTVRHVLPPAPTPFDAIDATRLALRLEILAAVLDDLPKEALRFARWRARRDARLAALLEARAETPDRHPSAGRPTGLPTGLPTGRRAGGGPVVAPTRRFGRLSPLRPGRAPGSRRRGRREVHQILANLQHFALEVLEAPDTS
ncbi:hypothetical protein RHIZO_01546 [Rhizobiaceae bacterium]|nr:hypothetical protein RHIZO_01546 [Rhizobiaceae bacterium]